MNKGTGQAHYGTVIRRCQECGRRRYVTTHHLKDENGNRTMGTRRICRQCHDKEECIRRKKTRHKNEAELNMKMKVGMTVYEFRILRGFRMLEEVEE